MNATLDVKDIRKAALVPYIGVVTDRVGAPALYAILKARVIMCPWKSPTATVVAFITHSLN